MNTNRSKINPLAILGALLGSLLLTLPATAEESYSYPSVLEGSATLFTVEGEREELVENQALLVGDSLWVPRGTRLELVLADNSLLRVEGESELTFDAIAYSADTGDEETALRLPRGDFQLIVPTDVLGKRLARLDTERASIYIHREGTFRLAVRNGGTELIVRDGLAELVTDSGSRLVRAGESAWAGDYRGRIDIRPASYRDGLERWGDALSERVRLASLPYVDDSLRYRAAPLANHGSWVEIGGRHAWRPRLKVEWRPYSRGYWRSTPVGLTWVSNDPWGYVTHHYGDWDYHGSYGWVWYPGRTYSPARVHWYWGPKYVGWCPTGYYNNYYRNRHSGFSLRFGIYGWAGGGWDPFFDWSFTATVNFGKRYKHRGHRDHGYIHSGRYLRKHGHHLDRGLIAHDPHIKGRRADEIYRNLKNRADEHRRAGHRLVDVDDFVAKKPLREELTRVVLHQGEAPRPVVERPTRRPTPPATHTRITDNHRGAGGGVSDRGTIRDGNIRSREIRPRIPTHAEDGRRTDGSILTDRPNRPTVTRPDRPGTVTRPDRPSTVTRPDRPGTVTRPDRPGTVTRPDRPGTVTRPDRPGTVTRPDRPGTVTRPDRPGTVTRPDRPGTVTRPDRPGTVTRPDRPGTVTRPDRPGTVTRPDRPSTVTRPDRPTSVTRPDRPTNRPTVTRPDRPSTVTRPDRPSNSRPTLSRPARPSSSSRPGTVSRPSTSSRPDRSTVSRPSTSSRPDRSTVSRPSTSSRPDRSTVSRPSTSSRPDHSTVSRPSTSSRPDRSTVRRPSTSSRPDRSTVSRPSTNRRPTTTNRVERPSSSRPPAATNSAPRAERPKASNNRSSNRRGEARGGSSNRTNVKKRDRDNGNG